MTKEQRVVYKELADVVDYSLCSFCESAEPHGSPCCGDMAIECHHPLYERLPAYEEWLEPGSDCWGFRPEHPIDLIADFVGIILAKGWASASWWKNETDNQWKISGTA